MNDRYYAIANQFAEIQFQLKTGRKYIIETDQKYFGMAQVYDLEGNFLKYAQIDNFNDYERIS